MDAFVLGAVPPYAQLLGGKLVAALVTSSTVQAAFARKYGGSRSLIRQEVHDGQLALVTTTSALGRSSLYNRLRGADGRTLYQRVGFTKGSGDFHFTSDMYAQLAEFVHTYCEPTAKQQRWGTGFRNRREVVRKGLAAVGLSADWLYLGVAREVFMVPLAANTQAFLCGASAGLQPYGESEDEIMAHFRKRWLLPAPTGTPVST